jgi:hypothetical protein
LACILFKADGIRFVLTKTSDSPKAKIVPGILIFVGWLFILITIGF